ncbi:MAG: PilN domain-containing protein, partial [Gammaproteobacteria bacterium]
LEAALRTLAEKQTVLALVNGSALGDTQGFSRHLKSLAMRTVDGLWLTQVTLSGTGEKTELQGLARRPELVPTYVQTLAGESPFAQQRFQQFRITRPDDTVGDVVEFSMNSEPFAPSGLASVR